MKRLRNLWAVLAVLTIALVMTACGTTEPAADTATTTTEQPVTSTTVMAMDDHEHDHEHEHGTQPWDGDTDPTVALEVVLDSSSGVNVFADVSGFRFAPESASTDHVAGEGHAHIEVDGEKVARVYGPAFHLVGLEPGQYEVSYVLAANTHDVYTVDDEPLGATVSLTVPEPSEDGGHSHSHDEPREWDGATEPEVLVTVVKDPKSGWNLIADLTGFELTPEAVGGEHVPGQGHAHIYVDGRKVARVYNTAFHLEELPAGDVLIEYRLSGNDHVEYDVSGSTALHVMAEDGTDTDPDTGSHGDGTEVVVEGGSPVGGPVTIKAELGSEVHITVKSDQPEQVHVHGYDLFYDVSPDAPAHIMFVADVPGVFEIELEGPHTLIAELEVS